MTIEMTLGIVKGYVDNVKDVQLNASLLPPIHIDVIVLKTVVDPNVLPCSKPR